MSTKRTQEEYVELLKELGNNEYELVENEIYQHNKHRLKTLHKPCGKVTEISPRNFINGQRCFECSKEERIQKMRTEKHLEFIKKLKKCTKGEYELLNGETFKNTQTKIKLLHTTCGNIYEVRPNDFKNGSRCPECRSTHSKSQEQFLIDFDNEGKLEYEVVEGEVYINSATSIKIKHRACNHTYSVVPQNFLRGQGRCQKCRERKKQIQKNNPKKIEQFINRVKELVQDEYIVVDSTNLLNSKSKVRMKHTLCNRDYEVCVNNFIQGSRCPKCANDAKKFKKRRTKTHEEFINEVLIQGNGEYELVEGEQYINNRIHVKMKHNSCGFEYPVSPGNFLKGTRCPLCAKENSLKKNKKSHEQFLSEVFEKVGREYSVLSPYINSEVKVTICHNTCGYDWDVNPHSFLGGTRCPKCKRKENAEKRRKGLAEFIQQVYELEGNKYIVKEGQTYKNNRTPLAIEHVECGHEYTVRPSNFINGRRCPNCSDKNRGTKTRKSLIQLKKEIHLFGEDEYALTPNAVYINTDTPTEMIHKTCGHTWKVAPSAFIRGVRCPNCHGGVKRTHEQFIQDLKKKTNDEFIVAAGQIYENNITPIKLIHKECQTEYITTPSNILNNGRCPTCVQANLSKGEEEIAKILKLNTIDFSQQHSFENCKHKRLLRFDFAIFDNDQVVALIEYNGIQHYQAIDYFGGEEALKITQKRDNIKRKYCKAQKIPLIEIRYDEELLSRLTKELAKLQIHIAEKMVS